MVIVITNVDYISFLFCNLHLWIWLDIIYYIIIILNKVWKQEVQEQNKTVGLSCIHHEQLRISDDGRTVKEGDDSENLSLNIYCETLQ